MKNKAIIITAILLIVSIGNHFRLFAGANIRTVEFLSALAIGALTGILLTQIFKMVMDKR